MARVLLTVIMVQPFFWAAKDNCKSDRHRIAWNKDEDDFVGAVSIPAYGEWLQRAHQGDFIRF